MNNQNEIILFETTDKSISLPVSVEHDTVWLSANQMSLLFERDEKTIRGVKQLVPFYTLDVIISVGYRVKSKRGVEFRRWATLS